VSNANRVSVLIVNNTTKTILIKRGCPIDWADNINQKATNEIDKEKNDEKLKMEEIDVPSKHKKIEFRN
jgi:hypothetical protein